MIGVVKADGDESRLAVRTGKKLVREDILRVQIAASTVRYDLDSKLHRVWNQGSIRVGDLWDYYTKYPYLPRLRDKGVLTEAIAEVMTDISWVQTGFALATAYDAESGEFAGLAIPNEDVFGKVQDDTYLVAPHAAQAQRRREQAAAEAAAKARRRDGRDSRRPRRPSPSPEAAQRRHRRRTSSRTGSTAPGSRSTRPSRRRWGRASSRPSRRFFDTSRLPRVPRTSRSSSTSAPRTRVGFSESVARTVKENSRVLGLRRQRVRGRRVVDRSRRRRDDQAQARRRPGQEPRLPPHVRVSDRRPRRQLHRRRSDSDLGASADQGRATRPGRSGRQRQGDGRRRCRQGNDPRASA